MSIWCRPTPGQPSVKRNRIYPDGSVVELTAKKEWMSSTVDLGEVRKELQAGFSCLINMSVNATKQQIN